MKGDRFKPKKKGKKAQQKKSDRPLLVFVPGLTSHSLTPYVVHIVESFYNRGFDVAVINYRGLAGAKLNTPRLYTANATDDVREPIKWIYEKYIKQPAGSPIKEAPVVAMGCSLGASNLANVLGDSNPNKRLPFLKAAMCMDVPMKFDRCLEILKSNLFGFFDIGLGANMVNQLKRHQKQVPETMKKMKDIYDIDLSEFLRNQKAIPSIIEYDKKITCPMFGYKNPKEYYDQASCARVVKNIQTPTLFFNCLGDPLVKSDGIAWDEIAENRNTMLCTTKFGGHIGYHQRTFDLNSQWFLDFCVDYFEGCLSNC